MAKGREKSWCFRDNESSQGPKITLFCLNQNKRRTKWLLHHTLQIFSVSLNTGGIWAGICHRMELIQPSEIGTRRVQVAKQRNIQHLAWSRFLVGQLRSDPQTHPSGLVRGLRVSGWASAGAPPPFFPSSLPLSQGSQASIHPAFVSSSGLPILSLILYFGHPLPLRHAMTEDSLLRLSILIDSPNKHASFILRILAEKQPMVTKGS